MPSDDDRAEATFHEALDKGPVERESFIARSCHGDESLQRQVKRLLAAHDGAGDYLDPPNSPEIEAELARLKPEEAGDRIGLYKLLEQLGEGGFGTVWVAEQAHPVRRRVALKIIKLGMDTKEVVGRFEQERQALAMMDHPNIAKVFDAGTTPTGRPYFVMELVRGIKLTQYCDEQELTTPQRIDLFTHVCHAVQHAHQKGIIHRDLKPSNILVTINEAEAVPKVIDFGVAKATQGRLIDQTVYTQFQQMIGTPVYMSPEQAEMTSLDIDTRSDIYSLGVLLYELLTGRTPIDQKTLAEVGLDEVRRVIREVDPPRPSMRVRMLEGGELTTTAKRRHVDPLKLRSQLKGDLDWIVMKCLEKDRRRRYDSVSGLALDLRRHLKNELIAARPPTSWYLVSKIIRRNRLGFIMGAAIVFLLITGAAISTVLAFRANRAETLANRSREEAEAIVRFLTFDLLYQATPDENAREKKVTMEEALDRAAHKLDEDPSLAGHPTIEATIRLAVGNTYYALGILPEAERHLRRAVALRRNTLGPENKATLAAQEEFARFLVLGAQKFKESEVLGGENLRVRERILGPEDPDTVESRCTYAYALANLGRLPEAESLTRRALAKYEQRLGPNDFKTINTLGDLAMMILWRGDVQEFAKTVQEEFSRWEKINLLNKKEALYSANNLGLSHLLLGKTANAEKVLTAAIARAAPIFGEDNNVTSHLRHNLARTLTEQNLLTDADKVGRQALEARKRREPGQESTARSHFLVGRIAVLRGETEEAEKHLTEALELFQKVSPMKPELQRQAEHWLGALKLKQGDDIERAKLLLTAGIDQLFAPTTSVQSKGEQRDAMQNIVNLYLAIDQPKLAEEWQRKLTQLGLPPRPPEAAHH